ncbi:MAG: hypothetical protein V3S64_01910 [bacterium]
MAGAQDDKPPALGDDTTDPSQDIIIEGLGFSKLILAISAGEKISKTGGFGRVQRLLEKNLCWSGVFNLSGGTSRFCRIRGNPERVDMRLTLSLEKRRGVLRLYDTGPEKLKLFGEAFALGKAAREWRIMMMINRLTKRITGQPGLLGSTIGFVLRQPGYAKVIVHTNTHGRVLRLLSQHDDINILPRFAPYGRGMVYTVLGRRGSHVFYKNLRSKAKNVPQSHFLTPPGSLNSGGAFSPDGRRVVVTMSINQNADLFMFDLMRKRHYQLTTRSGIETQAHWSPDGKKLIFVSDRSGTPQIYLMDMQKREDVRMTFEAKYNADPKWSPDGKSILFTRRYQGIDQIHIMDQFGAKVRMVSRGRFYSEQAEWSPDGRQIVFASNRTGEFKLYIVSADGSNLRRLTHTQKGFEENSPTWTSRKLFR